MANEGDHSASTYSIGTEVEVRWGDMDNQGHVNNAVYFTYYCESARVSLFGRLDIMAAERIQRGPVSGVNNLQLQKGSCVPCDARRGLAS